MTPQINQAAITQYWYLLEQLNLFDLDRAKDNNNYTERVLAADQNNSLPWLNPEILTQKFKLHNSSDGKFPQQEYQVYLGVFSSSSVIEFIKSLPKKAKAGFEDPGDSNPIDSCYASIKINSEGLLVEESLQCATAPWALQQIEGILTGKKKISVDTWTEDFHKHVNNLQEILTGQAKAFAASGYKLTVADLEKLLGLISKDLWQPKAFKEIAHYIIKDTNSKTDDGASEIIGSFFLDDLAISSAATKAGTASPALQQYLTSAADHVSRSDVQEASFLQHWLSPKNLPLGRWPSDPDHNLSLMQQLAVNLAIGKLKNDDGLFSVNGPPGTGKTTLLRDLVADLIVQRAEKMIGYDDPRDAFLKKGDYYRPLASITGFEIVVASSNNAAVENISLELPAIEAIDGSYQERASYLRAVSESVKASLEQQHSQNTKKASYQAMQGSPISEEDAEELIPTATWGLIAARLGRKSNCKTFCEGFWWDKDGGSIKTFLYDKPDPQQWPDAQEEFSRCQEVVQTLIGEREAWCQLLETQKSTSELGLQIKAHLGNACGDSDWWGRSNEELQLSAPWVDRELNQARTELFMVALQVHEQFIRRAAVPIKKNLERWEKLVKGDQKNLSDDQILQLWQTFFLVVPVASTTLASMRRLLGRLPTASLGWLLVDEAGQAIPQAAVGALQRTKRAVIVGDPLQIEPVFTQDTELVEDLKNYFAVEDCWNPQKSSIQTLSDRANPLGTNIKVSGEPLWIGCPLWVHRRCIDPMAIISNKIAYEDKMVVATRSPRADQLFPLGDSRWFDIEGRCEGKHWVAAQGEKVVEMLAELVRVEQALPSIYMISPFTKVSSKLRELLKQRKSQWATGLEENDIDGWIKKSVGTVHTFQGKEADAVIFILGGDDNSQGALNWASDKPNILNVAATRAKYRLYVVGTHRLWSKLRNFDEASSFLPLEAVAILEPVRIEPKPPLLSPPKTMQFYPHDPFDKNVCQNKLWDWLKLAFKDDDEGVAYYRFPVFLKTGKMLKEPDILILHRKYGLWVFEVKGCRIGNIREIQDQDWQMNDWYEETSQPVGQAEDGIYAIKNKLEMNRDVRGLVWTEFRVALPDVKKQEWQDRGFDSLPSSQGVVWVYEDLTPAALKQGIVKAAENRQQNLTDEQWELVKAVLGGALPPSKPRPIPTSTPVVSPVRVINAIDARIKTLDDTQQEVAFSIPNGPQRLRGLAGTGKTVLLAKRAAKIHASHPDWNIAFVFFTRSLYEQVTKMIDDYYRDMTNGEEPNWEKINILHSWGSTQKKGFYKELARQSGHPSLSVSQIKQIIGEAAPGRSFDYACQDLEPATIPEIYDAILIDEGQDLPSSFYRLALRSLKDPKRLYWAYDEAQGISSLIIPDSKALFGATADGKPIVDVSGSYEGGILKSYRMNKCYRTNRKLLMTAHAINMGLFRSGGVLQGVSTKADWESLGYTIVEGDFSVASVRDGREVTITRGDSTSVHPINQPGFPHPESVGNVLISQLFQTKDEEIAWIANSVKQDLDQGLEAHDIMITAITGNNEKKYFKELGALLSQLGIHFYITTGDNPDVFRQDGCVTLSGIQRAKGNEAWKVYTARFHLTTQPLSWRNETELHKRNEAFVALTRAKVWAVITGLENYPIFDEVQAAVTSYPKFTFKAFNRASLSRSTDDES